MTFFVTYSHFILPRWHQNQIIQIYIKNNLIDLLFIYFNKVLELSTHKRKHSVGKRTQQVFDQCWNVSPISVNHKEIVTVQLTLFLRTIISKLITFEGYEIVFFSPIYVYVFVSWWRINDHLKWFLPSLSKICFEIHTKRASKRVKLYA